MEKVSVVIVSWNVADSLKRCLTSVFATEYPRLEVWVIDNDSSDDTLEVVKSFKRVKFIKNAANIGFPKAVNQGFKHATGDYVLLLNPDTKIRKSFIEQAVKFCKSFPDVGVMGPKFVDPDGTAQGSVFPEPSIVNNVREFWLGEKGLTSKFTPKQDWPHPVNAVSGGCMFIPRNTLKNVGYFTEKVFMYYEDLDFCRRIRNSGLKVYFNPEIEIVHEHGSSSKQSTKSIDYLTQASIWYNGYLKYFTMWFISWSGQKLRKLKH